MNDSRLGPEAIGLPMKEHRAVLILISAIAGMLGLIPCAIFAWWMGSRDLDAMHHGVMDSSGRALTNFGRFLGMAVTTLFVAGIVGGFLISCIL